MHDSHGRLVVDVLDEPLLLTDVRAVEEAAFLEDVSTDASVEGEVGHLDVVNRLQVGQTVYRADHVEAPPFSGVDQDRAVFAPQHLRQACSQSVEHDREAGAG